jgi:glucuronokinase
LIIQTHAYPRAGLAGNPSDGYFGKTISFVFRNYSANIVLYESPELVLVPALRDHSRFRTLRGLADDVRNYGYYGGLRLLKATVKRFVDYCDEHGHALSDRNFTIEYASNIPHQVGLAGSSAIITATLRALMQFYHVAFSKAEQANLALSVEQDELGISAGLQDRVVQAFEGMVYMDFDREFMEKRGYGRYELLNPTLLPKLYIAYRTELSEESGVYHSTLRERFDRGDRRVLAAMKFWARLTDKVRKCLIDGEGERIGEHLDANFDRRQAITHVSKENAEMVEAARACGASAKFTGSGGAIIGVYRDERMFNRLQKTLAKKRIVTIRPEILFHDGDEDL